MFRVTASFFLSQEELASVPFRSDHGVCRVVEHPKETDARNGGLWRKGFHGEDERSPRDDLLYIREDATEQSGCVL